MADPLSTSTIEDPFTFNSNIQCLCVVFPRRVIISECDTTAISGRKQSNYFLRRRIDWRSDTTFDAATLRQGNVLRAESYNPHRFARPFGFDQSIPAPGHDVKRVILNLSELAGYWAHMMRKGTGAAFVIMPDYIEGKMVF